ncbi:hypothetical protein LNA02_19000 [Levilactobacillus namurensis]|nr:hypothetical protein LNA02_19000 [Levilactobacillus namurensis]
MKSSLLISKEIYYSYFLGDADLRGGEKDKNKPFPKMRMTCFEVEYEDAVMG